MTAREMGVREFTFVDRVEGTANEFKVFEFTHETTSDQYGVSISVRKEVLLFKGSIVECQAYIALFKEGWIVRPK